MEAQATRPPLWLRLNCAERERPELLAWVTAELKGSTMVRVTSATAATLEATTTTAPARHH